MTSLISGIVIDFPQNPFFYGENAVKIWEDGAVLCGDDGRIIAVGHRSDLLITAGKLDTNYTHYAYPNYYIMAGFIDCHLHFPQIRMLACYGTRLLDWLNNYTFPEEGRYNNSEFAGQMAQEFLQIMINHGITTPCAYGAVFPQSVSVLFDAAQKMNYEIILGKVLMDRNAPEYLRDTPQSGYDDSAQLIKKYHGVGRGHYAITPRFAITSTPEQLQACGQLVRDFPGCYVQTHLSEQTEEVEYTMKLYPDYKNYSDIYDKHGLIHQKTLLGHAIYCDDDELACIKERGAVLVHCPTSNLFIGSGLFPFERVINDMKVSLATDIGGGTSPSMLTTIDNAYKIGALQKFSLHPWHSMYMASAGNAENLGLAQHIGRVRAGNFADLVVLNPQSSPELALRQQLSKTHADRVFAMQILGNAQTIHQCFVAGQARKNLITQDSQ